LALLGLKTGLPLGLCQPPNVFHSKFLASLANC
jgi:hypothetical protein